MRAERVSLLMTRAPLARPFENRWQRFESWTKVLVRVEAGGLTGLGECTAMETPYYNYETTETAWHVLERYLIPLVLRSGTTDPEAAARAWAHVNGHEEAKAALECALWDLRAKAAGVPLGVALGGERATVPVGATVGIEPTIDALVDAVARAHEAGYARVRIKIRQGWDVEPVKAVRSALPDVPLIADANAAYGAEDLPHLRALDGLGLLALEQPLKSRLIAESAALQASLATPVCLDESVKSLADVRQALDAGACRAVNVKAGRVGGLAEARRIHDACRDHGVPAFVGAKYDFGVGRWTNIALGTLANMTLPSDVGPTARYYRDDGTTPQVCFVSPGRVAPRPAPGLGVEITDSAHVVRAQSFCPTSDKEPRWRA
ncbi:o-succinylbenzoate synthase [Streptomyces cinnamoneus]|uniref:o-succinylbenzoate synthase n=1 Tax=Streptomyces cinnamoneus TaxID=53446 RepID=A0A2G1X9M3_STRCJ|nr:o-succinylbenzoate synthase [Streptomyces cinnamoneus]PHQ47934.1 o-succinylbenzoate synthase [Streptomyces cinnamoneus]PPT15559.1 o-succinylbenzoate synthase [Streptomyces cinnamoneus]